MGMGGVGRGTGHGERHGRTAADRGDGGSSRAGERKLQGEKQVSAGRNNIQ